MPYDPPAVNFDFSADQKALRDQARKFLAEHASSTRVRRILEGAAPYDADLWRGMGEMGWMGTAIPETHGGAGFGHLELCVIAEELGRSLAPTPFASRAATRRRNAGSPASRRGRPSAASRSPKGRRWPRPPISPRAPRGRG
jgi:alkylation response protein AidB-like acyl-CoA dehydrogenase